MRAELQFFYCLPSGFCFLLLTCCKGFSHTHPRLLYFLLMFWICCGVSANLAAFARLAVACKSPGSRAHLGQEHIMRQWIVEASSWGTIRASNMLGKHSVQESLPNQLKNTPSILLRDQWEGLLGRKAVVERKRDKICSVIADKLGNKTWVREKSEQTREFESDRVLMKVMSLPFATAVLLANDIQ